ncbi:hypothetical protein CALCODRAFT_478752 [Calocera cornea HHB12733]|uniref:Uncharacterized protein n=1 Tax=Calocera cornea HHB12733 TaxID=1353952 RepID=A0A165K978_9BASI|nr:hypothetical protein CALCODRAFT_478752 [Calocera cornea HHB12733]
MSDPHTPTLPSTPLPHLPPRLPTLRHLPLSLSPSFGALRPPSSPSSTQASTTPKASALNASGRLLSPLLGEAGGQLPSSNSGYTTGRLLSPLFPRALRSPSSSSPSALVNPPTPRSTPHQAGTERTLSPSAHLALMHKRISSPLHLAQAQAQRQLQPPFPSFPSFPSPPTPAHRVLPAQRSSRALVPRAGGPPRLTPAQVRKVLDELERADEDVRLRCARLREDVAEVRREARNVAAVYAGRRRRGE